MVAGKKLPSFNSLIYFVCRGPVFKNGAVVVAGILSHLDKIKVISGIGQKVYCYESSRKKVESRVFQNFEAFYLPAAPKNAVFDIDNQDPIKNIGTLFLFESVPICCDSFAPSAIIVGAEPLLREALKGRKFIPRAYFADYAAMELLPCH